ncbi:MULTISPECIES: LytTR family DNA-binding domain-containing protein [Lysinibacillus]|uniref:LytTR family DNA-binding domain-containing protein n=1 Tax=Lysinibacillus TaxID=400634 RepID=UPI0030FB81C8
MTHIIKETDHLIIFKQIEIFKLKLQQIILIEKLDEYTFIYSIDQTVKVRKSLKSIESILPSNFIRTNQSFIINKNHLLRLERLNSNVYKAFLTNSKQGIVNKNILNNLLNC